jgi:hypothetical protein
MVKRIRSSKQTPPHSGPNDIVVENAVEEVVVTTEEEKEEEMEEEKDEEMEEEKEEEMEEEKEEEDNQYDAVHHHYNNSKATTSSSSHSTESSKGSSSHLKTCERDYDSESNVPSTTGSSAITNADSTRGNGYDEVRRPKRTKTIPVVTTEAENSTKTKRQRTGKANGDDDDDSRVYDRHPTTNRYVVYSNCHRHLVQKNFVGNSDFNRTVQAFRYEYLAKHVTKEMKDSIIQTIYEQYDFYGLDEERAKTKIYKAIEDRRRLDLKQLPKDAALIAERTTEWAQQHKPPHYVVEYDSSRTWGTNKNHHSTTPNSIGTTGTARQKRHSTSVNYDENEWNECR